MDKHSELQYPVFSPRFALVYKHNPSNTFRFTYNRSFGTPSSNNLWLDLQAGLAATPFAQSLGLAFQVRAQGVPSSGFNFSRDALGNPHWYSPANNTAIGGTGPNTPLAFNSAAAWPFLSRILAEGMAIGLRGFYIQQGMSGDDARNLANQEVAKMDLSRPANIALLMRVLNTATSQFGDPVSDVVNISRMKPTIYNTFEVGYKGIINNKLLLTTDFYYTRAYDFVGPLIVETPNVFMSEPDMISFMSEKLAGAQGINTAIATIIASNVAGALRGLPVGVVSPRETFYKDAMVLTYRNFGEINYFGIDLGFEYLIGSEYRVMGNYSYISNDKWLNLDGREGFDIYLNAPQNKAMIGFGYKGRSNGVSANIRYRWIQGFEIESGIYSTERRNALGQLQHVPIPDYSVLDLNFGYEIKQVKGLRANLTITNALNRRAPQFAGTPDIGRLTIAGLTYNF
jgi:iron complex outermembrane receptor protein